VSDPAVIPLHPSGSAARASEAWAP